MKPTMSALLVLGALLVGMTLGSEGLAQGGDRWEYAYMAKRFSSVTLTRIAGDRCVTEAITVPDAARFALGTDGQLHRAATAITRLSEDGWEMVGDGVAYCDQADENLHAIHFRRRR